MDIFGFGEYYYKVYAPALNLEQALKWPKILKVLELFLKTCTRPWKGLDLGHSRSDVQWKQIKSWRQPLTCLRMVEALTWPTFIISMIYWLIVDVEMFLNFWRKRPQSMLDRRCRNVISQKLVHVGFKQQPRESSGLPVLTVYQYVVYWALVLLCFVGSHQNIRCEDRLQNSGWWGIVKLCLLAHLARLPRLNAHLMCATHTLMKPYLE